MIYLTIFLFLIILILSFVIYNLLSQNNQMEASIKKGYADEETFIKYYEVILGILVKTKVEMERIDFRGSFQADDEVGFTFKSLQGCIDNVVSQIKELRKETTE